MQSTRTHHASECKLDGCPRPVQAKGWCANHYNIQRMGRVPKLTGRNARERKQKPPCSVQGCDKPSRAKGLCKTHHNRQLEGRPLVPTFIRMNASVPLDEILKASSKRDEETGCLVWTRFLRNGYGYVRGVRVHRIAYELANGKIPNGLVIDHMCHNKACIEPAHLRAVTAAQNAQNRKLAANNTSGMRNVSYDKRTGQWYAQLRANDVLYTDHGHKTFESACDAAARLRAKHFTHSIEEFSTKR